MNRKGLTLVETIVASAVFSTLMLGAIPPTVKMIQQKAVQTTAKEILVVQEAEKNYWIDKLNATGRGEWADSIASLQSEGYLPADWNMKNLFQNDYVVSTTATTCEVQTTIPKGLEGVVQTICPQVNVSYAENNAIVSSTIPIPGQEPTMEALLHRTGDIQFRVAEEPVGSKEYIVAGTDLTEVESKIQKGKIEKKPDIYSKALAEQGISSTGWLSDAEFPAQIDPQKRVCFYLDSYNSNPAITLPKNIQVLEKKYWRSDWNIIQGPYELDVSSNNFYKRYQTPYPYHYPNKWCTRVYMKWKNPDTKIYECDWQISQRKIIFSEGTTLFLIDILDRDKHTTTAFERFAITSPNVLEWVPGGFPDDGSFIISVCYN